MVNGTTTPKTYSSNQNEGPDADMSDVDPNTSNQKHHNQHYLTIVTQLSGELGNQIAKLATGVALALEWQQRNVWEIHC